MQLKTNNATQELEINELKGKINKLKKEKIIFSGDKIIFL